MTPEERKELVAQAKAEKEQKAMESALRKKELQDCKSIEYGAKLTEVMWTFCVKWLLKLLYSDIWLL